LLLPALETLGKLRRGVDGTNEGIPLRKLLLGTVLMVLGILLAYSPQVAVSKVLYGKYLVNPITAHLGQEAWDMWADFSHPRFFHVLFSPRIGLFSWTPVLIFAVAGLYWLYLKDRLTGVLFLMILMLEIYIVASWEKGEQGSSFGGRMFISCTPIFILGLASLIDRLRQIISMKSIVIASLVFIIWNLGLVLQFAMGWYPRMYNLGEVSWSEVVRNQFLRVPAYLLDRVIALIRGV
jgi:hypothetical protein